MNRRYNYVKYSNDEVLGKVKFCPDKLPIKSWWRGLYHCSYCFCYCDEPGLFSDRYFSLREVTSDISLNK